MIIRDGKSTVMPDGKIAKTLPRVRILIGGQQVAALSSFDVHVDATPTLPTVKMAFIDGLSINDVSEPTRQRILELAERARELGFVDVTVGRR